MKENAIVFIKTFVVIFIGFTICNVVGVFIEKLIYDVNIKFGNIFALPYLIYFIFSLVLSLAFTFFLNRLKK